MDQARKKKKSPKLFQFLVAYVLGFFSWLAGLHCLNVDEQGRLSVDPKRFRRHLLKVFLWTLEINLVVNLMGIYRNWLMNASVPEVETAFLVKSIIFLYIKVFWPRVFPEILPGMHVFFCPQCYQRQTFRFQPVAFSLGFWVTYLCRNCFCLVNGWGEQIFYPVKPTFNEVKPSLTKTLPVIIVALVLGMLAFQFIWNAFN